MTGTEKQIKWAEEIIERVNASVLEWSRQLNAVIEKMNADQQRKARENEQKIKAYVENLNNSYAGDVIDRFKNHEAGDVKDLVYVVSKYDKIFG